VDAVALIAVVALLALVAWFVSRPLRTDMADRAQAEDEGRRADLEAAKDAKYREIRDLEMDLRTGKLSEEDWRALDRELRAEAVDILHELDRLGA
jgi:flagellar biosynthesis/type III secretory pathway M-ring protein FliF/YscJ